MIGYPNIAGYQKEKQLVWRLAKKRILPKKKLIQKRTHNMGYNL